MVKLQQKQWEWQKDPSRQETSLCSLLRDIVCLLVLAVNKRRFSASDEHCALHPDLVHGRTSFATSVTGSTAVHAISPL